MDILENNSFDFSKLLWAHGDNEGNFEVIEQAFTKGA